MSTDVPVGSVIGRDFLDGRVIVYRGADGQARVFSAYCPHLGADLANGQVVGNAVRCAFHHWEFGPDGFCQKTGIGDPAPPNACVFKFPTCEKFGLVWAFNGEAPLFELAELTRPIDSIRHRVAPPIPLTTDPWVICCNTPDWAHFATVHRFGFPVEGQNQTIAFQEFGVTRAFSANLEGGAGPEIHFKVTVRGTNLVLIEGVIGDSWFGVAGCLGVPRPGRSDFYVVTFVDEREFGSAEAASQALQAFADIGAQMTAEDSPIWNTIRFRPGALTLADKALAQYLQQLRVYPRAHPSADFIN
jgi:nitrite reductase/ring-hydroxylating ferredoxin subunit